MKKICVKKICVFLSLSRKTIAFATLLSAFVQPALARADDTPTSTSISTATATATATSTSKIESNVVSLVDRQGFRWRTPSGDFEFNPYLLMQAQLHGKVVSNEWLDLADQDRVTELGFGTSNALLGLAGRGFGRIAFNLTLNAACGGSPCLLNQAWADITASEALRLQVGKFKTPMHWAFQVRIGQTQMPRPPASLTAAVNLPFGLNAADPSILTGFDTGAMLHGTWGGQLGYQVGIFSGEGIGVNAPKSTLSDDLRIPGLLYAGRITYTPFGAMPLQEGSNSGASDLRLLVGASTSYNIEANAESSNDLRAGLEVALAVQRFYWATEAYALRMDFVERQRGTPSRLFWGAYTQLGYRFDGGFEPVIRFESFDRNSTDAAGVALIPAVGVNYYFYDQNLKLQAMVQELVRSGYENSLRAHQDDNAMPDHLFVMQLQFVL